MCDVLGAHLSALCSCSEERDFAAAGTGLEQPSVYVQGVSVCVCVCVCVCTSVYVQGVRVGGGGGLKRMVDA